MLRQISLKKVITTVQSLINTSYSCVAAINGEDFKTLSGVKQWNEIPGPTSLPLIGQLLCYTPQIGNLDISNELESQTYLYDNYGPVVRLEGLRKEKSLYLFDSDDVRQLYSNEMSLPNRNAIRPLTYYQKVYKKTEEERNQPASLITENNENWRVVRTAANPIFLKPDVIKSYEGSLNEIADEMIERIRNVRNSDKIFVNSLEEFAIWVLETTGATHFGRRIHCMNSKEGTPQRRLIQTIVESFQLSEALDYDPKYGLWKIISTPSFRRAMALFEEHDKLVTHFIDESTKIYEKERKSKRGPKPIFQKLSEHNKQFAINAATDALIAGMYTTSTMTQLILYNLAKHPDVQQKLRVSLAKDDYKYLKACIKESMRLNPAVSRVKRTVTKDQVLGGYLIPKGTDITVAHHYASMQEYNFPKPTEYIPERWLVGKDHPLYYGNAHPYAYMPFGFGVRHCIGKRLALMNLKTLMGKIIKNFKVSWTSERPVKIVKKVNNIIEDSDYIKFEDLPENEIMFG